MASPDSSDPTPPAKGLPAVAAAMIRSWIPPAERAEVLADVAESFAARRAEAGPVRARLWLWGEVARSVPPLVRRSWARGWSGFESNANRMRPGGSPMESWIMDIRYAARRLLSRPTYALLAVLTLALGVGGTTAIFGIVRRLLFDPLPYGSEAGLAVFWGRYDWSEAEFTMLEPDIPGFTGLAAFRPGDVTLDPADDVPARLLTGIASSASLFDVLAAGPALGRTFRPGEDRQGAEAVAVLSHGLWREMGGDPAIVGRRVRMGGIDRTVVGVMPPGFWFPSPDVQVWTPAPLDPEQRSGQYTLIGRLPAGRNVAEMGAPLGRITAMLGERFDYPEQWDKTRNPSLTPIREHLVGSLRPALVATAAALSLILLIACANVAALMLGQVEGRTAELAIRSAMGADRRRLTQQLVAEAVLVGGLAGLAGVGLAVAGFRLLRATLPLGPWAATASLDWSLFGVAIVLAVGAAVLIAIVPTIALWRGDLRGSLTRARTSSGGKGSRMEDALVVGEVAVAVLMAAGAALLVRSVTRMYAIDPGIATEGVAVVDVTMPVLMGGEQRRQSLRELITELSAVPGVASASAVQKLPLRGRGDSWGITLESRPELPPTTTYYRIVGPGYFETMGYRLVSGRTFEPNDRAGTEMVIVINEALARQYFPDRDPLGQRVREFGGFARIVGVVADASEGNLTDPPAPARYVLYDQIPYTPGASALVLRLDRAGTGAGQVLESARQVVRRLAPGIAIQQTTSIDRVFTEAVGPVRQVMALLALLTGLAMVLGAIGVYGVISHFVNRRMRDWGIRIALGLQPGRLIGMVVGRGAGLVAAGAAIGIVGALVTSRFLTSFLYGVEAGDPVALAAATAALLLVGVLAAWLPAHRASRVDPASVLGDR